jgi:hypothetical protein
VSATSGAQEGRQRCALWELDDAASRLEDTHPVVGNYRMPDTEVVTPASRDDGESESVQLTTVPSDLPRAPRGRVVGRPFERNNRMQVIRRVPPDSIAELDEIARDTVRRLRGRRNPDGKLREMDAPSANAIFVGLRLRMELHAAFEANARLAEMQSEIARLQDVITSRLGG